jgi:phage internal scaffolding protein
LETSLETSSSEKLIRGYNSPRLRVQSVNNLPSRTDQSAKEECDINNIVDQYMATGLITHLNANSPQYGDATGIDFQNSMELILHAQEQFGELPSDVRKYFNNDPGAFLDFAQDPSNHETLVELGLATPRPETAQTASPEVSEPPPETSPAA